MPSIDLSTGSIHYSDTGEGIPVVPLHANPGYSRDFDAVLPANKDGQIDRNPLPLASFVTLPCGHASFAELPELFLSEVQPFLEKCINS